MDKKNKGENKMKIREYMSLPDNDIGAKEVLMEMDKEDVVDRYIYKENRRWVGLVFILFVGAFVGIFLYRVFFVL